MCIRDRFDASNFSVQISGPVLDFNVDDFIDSKEQKKMDKFIHYGLAAGIMAIEDSGIEINENNSNLVGVSIGSGIGGLPYIEKNYEVFMKNGPRRISPFFVPSSIINMVSGNLSIKYGIIGPNLSLVSACATGTHSIGEAARLIKHGYVDCMIAGGAEMATCPLGIGGFASAKALCSTNNDDPETASKPWDINRNGFVLGDGAGILILEDYESAKKRNADLLRKQLEKIGQKECWELLKNCDPISTKKINPTDHVRTIRALEVFYATGKPFSAQKVQKPPNWRVLELG